MTLWTDDFDEASIEFGKQVRARAAEYVRSGQAAPFEAIDLARKAIMQERRAQSGLPPLEKAP